MSGGGFPWRWVIAALAVGVVAVTVLVPPPGTGGDESGSSSEAPADTAAGPDTATIPDPVPLTVPDTIRVLVLNGTDIDGLAGRTQMRLLRSSTETTVILAPFDPSDTDEKPYPETVIISHLADLSSAAAVAGILGLPDDRIVWEVPSGGQVPGIDVTVCLGADIGEEPSEIE